ncbi:MAG: hypothetical protein ACLTXI_02215 [Collinsella sp.]
MNNSLRGRDYINIHDLSSEDFRYLIDLAWNLKAQKKSGVDQRYFPGKNVLANFEWGSTRTVAHSRPPAMIWAWASLI